MREIGTPIIIIKAQQQHNVIIHSTKWIPAAVSCD
jgi:hypothetical protein